MNNVFTELNIIKLKKNPQPNRNRTESFKYLAISKNVGSSLVRRRVMWRLTRLETMINVLEYRKPW